MGRPLITLCLHVPWRDVYASSSTRRAWQCLIACSKHPYSALSLRNRPRAHASVLFSALPDRALVRPVADVGYFFWEGAQKIDARQAPWREFDISIAPDQPEAIAAIEPPAAPVTTSEQSTSPGPAADPMPPPSAPPASDTIVRRAQSRPSSEQASGIRPPPPTHNPPAAPRTEEPELSRRMTGSTLPPARYDRHRWSLRPAGRR